MGGGVYCGPLLWVLGGPKHCRWSAHDVRTVLYAKVRLKTRLGSTKNLWAPIIQKKPDVYLRVVEMPQPAR